MNKLKRKSAEPSMTPISRRKSNERCEEFKTPLIMSSKTKYIEKPAPKLIKEKKVNFEESAGVGRVIKYLHARDACMQNNALFEDKKNLAVVDKKNYLKNIISILTYGIFLLFFTISVLSIYTLIDTDNYRLVSINDLISTVELPSIEDIYYFGKESKEYVKEAFEYLNKNKLNKISNNEVLINVTNRNINIDKSANKRSLNNLLLKNNDLNINKYDNVNKSKKLNASDLINTDMSSYKLDIKNEFNEDESLKVNKKSNKNAGLVKEKLIYWDDTKNFSLVSDKKNNNLSKLGLNEIIQNETKNSKLIKLILNNEKSEVIKFDSNIIELLCYYNFTNQYGIINLYYNELEHNLKFIRNFVEEKGDYELIKSLTSENILNTLEFEKPYELLVLKNEDELKKNEILLNVDRRIVVSSGYNNEIIKDFCLYRNNWLCKKYETLILKLLLEFYNKKSNFISYFLKEYKKKVIDKYYLDNISFFTKNQIMIVNSLFPGLFVTFETMKKGLYEKIYQYEKRTDIINKNILKEINDKDIDWIISLILSHSLQDKENNIAFVPYYSAIPHSSDIFDDCNAQTISHYANSTSFEWKYSFKKCDDKTKKNKYMKIYTHYGQLNNIKLLVQYGKILNNNNYSSIWFLRRSYFPTKNNLDFENELNILFGTNTIINDINSELSKKLLPQWLLNNETIQINATTAFVHYISNNKVINIKKNLDEKNLNFVQCNSYTFYNGVGSGFGTIQFTRTGQVGGIPSTTYICLREIIFRNNFKMLTKEEEEEKLINIIYNNCNSRSQHFSNVKKQLIEMLKHELLDKNKDLTKLSNKIKQEIRINIKLLYISLEELQTMKKCVLYFNKLREFKKSINKK